MSAHRKRLRRFETGSARYLTFSCHRRLPLLGRAEWRDVFADSLRSARERYGFALIAWVVMPEHVHLILLPRDQACPVPNTLRAIKQPVAQLALRRWRAQDAKILDQLRVGEGKYRFWQAGGGFDRNVRDQDELNREIEYVHANPVRRGLAESPTEWAWSSARWYAGTREGLIPIDVVRY